MAKTFVKMAYLIAEKGRGLAGIGRICNQQLTIGKLRVADCNDKKRWNNEIILKSRIAGLPLIKINFYEKNNYSYSSFRISF